MRRILSTILAFVFVLSFAGLAEAQQRFWLNLVGTDGSTITTGQCRIITAGSNIDLTIFDGRDLGTSITNPISLDANGVCSWYLAAGTTAVDVIVWVESGAYQGAKIKVDNVTRTSNHRVVIDRQHGLKTAYIPFTHSVTPTTSAVTLPAGSLITETFVETVTHLSSSGLDVQTVGGTVGELCDNLVAASGGHSTGSVGFVTCAPTDLIIATHRAIQYHTDGHNVAGYLSIYYFEQGNQ
ncbi:hypothetical protein LCGC14_2333490 [marine sediment metagenome]|uniref:Uncharacterized protein n=1 Tax=marine sediment metagenome TaxID=412755 RepID=A0A0F9CEZ4_9ZZZZ